MFQRNGSVREEIPREGRKWEFVAWTQNKSSRCWSWRALSAVASWSWAGLQELFSIHVSHQWIFGITTSSVGFSTLICAGSPFAENCSWQGKCQHSSAVEITLSYPLALLGSQAAFLEESKELLPFCCFCTIRSDNNPASYLDKKRGSIQGVLPSLF